MTAERWIPATWGDAHKFDHVKVKTRGAEYEFVVTEVAHPTVTVRRAVPGAEAKTGTPNLTAPIELMPMTRTSGDTGFVIFDEDRAAVLSGIAGNPDPAALRAAMHPERDAATPDPLAEADARREQVRATADQVFDELAAKRERAAKVETDDAVTKQFELDLPALKALRPLFDLDGQLGRVIYELGSTLTHVGEEVAKAYGQALDQLAATIAAGRRDLESLETAIATDEPPAPPSADCVRCAVARHQCPGCGTDVPHGTVACEPCSDESQREPDPNDYSAERRAIDALKAHDLEPLVIGRVLAIAEITEHLEKFHADHPVPGRDPDLTGIEYRTQLHDLHFKAHVKEQRTDRAWEPRGTHPHKHNVMDRPMR
jgi:hypothetical protein